MSNLPKGFVLDKDPGGLPAGFVLDEPPERSTAAKIVRGAALPVKGLQSSVLETVGAIPDLMWKGAGYLGVPQPKASATDTLKSIFMPGAERLQPESGTEKFLEGAGRGVGDVAAFMVPGAAAARVARAGSLPARVGGVMASQPAVQAGLGATAGGVTEATDSPALGLASVVAPLAAVAGARRLVSPVRSTLNAEQSRLAGVLENEGVDLSAGQRTGSQRLQAAESTARSLPLAGENAALANQQTQYTRAVLGKAGVNAELATPEALDAAQSTIGGTIGGATRGHQARLGDAFQRDVRNVTNEYTKGLKPDQKAVFTEYRDELVNWPGGVMEGQFYQRAREGIGKAIRAENSPTGDKRLQEALIGLRDALDDAMTRSMMRAGDVRGVNALKQARRDYANLMVIEDAAAKSGASGLITPSSLRSSLSASVGRRQYARGFGDLNELARAGEALMKPIPDSGTARRSFWTSLMTGGGGVGVGGYLSAGDPMAMAAGGAASLAVPGIVGRAINSRMGQSYLANQAASRPVVANGRGILSNTLLAREKDNLLGR